MAVLDPCWLHWPARCRGSCQEEGGHGYLRPPPVAYPPRTLSGRAISSYSRQPQSTCLSSRPGSFTSMRSGFSLVPPERQRELGWRGDSSIFFPGSLCHSSFWPSPKLFQQAILFLTSHLPYPDFRHLQERSRKRTAVPRMPSILNSIQSTRMSPSPWE